MTFSTLASPGVSLQGGGGSGGGGGGTPGGSNTQLQYNSSGVFGGAAGLTTDGTSLTITGGNLTMSGNISAPAWTTSGVRIKGVPGTLTDTTSSGTVAAAYTNVFGGNTIAASNATTFSDYFTTYINSPTAGTNVTFTRNWALGLGGSLQIASASQLGWSTDLILTRRGAANLRLGAADAAAPVAQTLSVQSVVAGTSNTAGANLTITGSQGTGTGAGGSIIFQVAPAGGSGTAQNALADALTINSARQVVSGIAGSAATPAYNFLSAGNGLYLSSNSVYLATSGSVVRFGFGTNGAELQSTGVVGWSSSSTDASTTKDLLLFRDAANTLALRNGANAQENRIYGTFTDTSNYRRVATGMSTAGVGFIRPEGAGTGASGNVIHISGLPTSNPGAGILWNDAGTVKVGT